VLRLGVISKSRPISTHRRAGWLCWALSLGPGALACTDPHGGAGSAGGTGGTAAAGASSGGHTGGQAASGGRASSGTGGTFANGIGGADPVPSYDCDARKIQCATLVPVDPCEAGKVYSVVAACYGTCVPIEECVCDEKADCPDPDGTEPYTCLMSRKHCTPWLE
jgi:hypothetical protein